MRFLHSLAAILAVFCCIFASAQTTTTFTGTIKDLTNTAATSGQVTFTLQPGSDTTIAGSARFTPQTVNCGINGSGALLNQALSGACVVTNNTALTPAGTSYLVQICPSFACTSKFVTYALGGSVDITQSVPTPGTLPAYAFVDTFSNQTIGGNKTFSGNVSFGSVSGAVLAVTAFTGADAGARIAACLAALPSTGGTCDGRGLQGSQVISSNPFSGITVPFTLLLGHATFAVNGTNWVIANDGASPPAQKAIHIIGVGVDAASITAGKTPLSGTIIDFQSTSGVVGFLDSRGAGVLEIEGVTFQSSAGSTVPFMQFTNTIPKIHDNQFYGSQSGTACNQDVIVLGGTTTSINGGPTAAFQGYGGYVTHNFFNHIRRAVYARTFVNGFPITENTIWVQSGSNLTGGAAIEFDGGSDNNIGNQITNNLLEVTNYPYGIKFTNNGFNNIISGNSFYDPSVTHLAAVRFEATSSLNYIVAGFGNDLYATISETGASVGKNMVLTPHQNQFSIFSGPVRFINAGSGSPVASVREEAGSVFAPMWNSRITTTNDEFYWGIGTAGQPNYSMWMYPAGGAGEELFTVKRYDINQRGIFITAPTTGYFECQADCRFRAAAGSTTWLGNATNSSAILISDTDTKFNGIINNSGTGWKHIHSATTCTTGAAVGATCTTAAISWNGTAFANTNYDLTCTLSGTLTNVPVVIGTTKSTGSFTVTIAALTAAAATYAEVDCDGKE